MRKRRTGIILIVIGVVLVIFGAVWMTVIFPALDKLPADLERAVQYEGTVSVFDSEAYQLVTYDVLVTRSYHAVKCRGDTLYLEEDVSFADAHTGQEIPSLHSVSLLAVDRVSRMHVPGHGDQNREGYWSFPRAVKADRNYSLWIEGNPTTLEARCVGEEDFRGLRVLPYEAATPEEGLTIPRGLFTPEMQLYQQIKMKVEPISGVTVYFENTIRITSKFPVFDDVFPETGNMTFTDMIVNESSMAFTEETVAQLVHDGKFYRWALPWGRTYMLWIAFGLGTALVALGSILLARKAESGH